MPVRNGSVVSDNRKLPPYSQAKEVGKRCLDNASMADNNDSFLIILPGDAVNPTTCAHHEFHQTVSIGGQSPERFFIPIGVAITLNNFLESQAFALAQVKLLDL